MGTDHARPRTMALKMRGDEGYFTHCYDRWTLHGGMVRVYFEGRLVARHVAAGVEWMRWSHDEVQAR